MQTRKEKKAAEQAGSVSRAQCRPTPHQRSSGETDQAFELGSSPMDGREFRMAAALKIKDPDHGDDYRGNDRPSPTFRGRSEVEDGNEEKKQCRGVAKNHHDCKFWEISREERYFGESRASETDPTGKPETKITRILIAAKEREKNEQNDGGGRFEESAAEQSLILQHSSRPPGRNCPNRSQKTSHRAECGS